MLINWILLFIGSLAVLLTAARYFTNAAEGAGQLLKLPAFVTGIFIVGIGTSLPELVTALLSISSGHAEIVAGNLIGANISNIFLIVGFTALLNRRTIDLGKRYLMIDLHYLLGSALVFYLFLHDGILTWKEGAFLIAIFLIYSLYLLKAGNEDELEEISEKPASWGKVLPILGLAGVGIYFGADYTVLSITKIAEILAIPPSIIALTVLSLGTTLPELAVNYFSVKQGKASLAIGNVMGSCIFNLLIIPGVASWVGNLTAGGQILSLALPILVAASVFFYLLAQDKRISTWEGALFLVLYFIVMFKTSGLI
ncbi:sodium:calcium antiporter [Runella slithyformis]|uniref:Sodium/calcium exchanger membrane region n=1 Tax=Runella slithyformis (strain ATCC 29530 / DSM 19594 / LMG 11500 / NCIMB 11436 / LSU 4) TaxID=761193 RepID=A0A7U3ZG47_RUNSL|nr:sodium:calcium antiporter [Runella slithyformis]AEI46492.1 sodium/calcium exchanger membrane region [Runella slithyformis DSM 19594]